MHHWILRRLRGWMSPAELYAACRNCPAGESFDLFTSELQRLIDSGEIQVRQWTVSGWTILMLAVRNAR